MVALDQQLTPTSSLEQWREAAALNNALFWEAAPKAMGGRWERLPGVWLADPAAPNPFPNSATLIAELHSADAGDLVATLSAYYVRHPGGPWLLWSAFPTPDLSPFGLTHLGCPPLMIRWPWQAPARTDPSELTIVEVDSGDRLRDWLDVLIDGYPAPEFRDPTAPIYMDERVLGGRMRLWVGYVNNRPVSCSAALTDDRVNGVFAVATVTGMRGRGYGAALTERAASADPARPALLTASDLGQPVYRSLGFQRLFDFSLWLGHRSGA